MRWTLRILAGLALLITAASLLATLPVAADQPPGLLPSAPAFASLDGDLAFATNIVGLVAAAQRRQWKWLVGLSALAVLRLLGPAALLALAAQAIDAQGHVLGVPVELSFLASVYVLIVVGAVAAIAYSFALRPLAIASSTRITHENASRRGISTQ